MLALLRDASMAPGPSLMKRTTIRKLLQGMILATAVITVVFRGRISETFGPMEQSEFACQICHRVRIQKWVCGSKVRDDIVTNQYSDWIDTFIPPDHQHVWCGHTHYGRSHWFGGTSIACGGCAGITTIPRIFERRHHFGELESQRLASRFHELVVGQSPESELDQFERSVVENSHSLPASDNSN